METYWLNLVIYRDFESFRAKLRDWADRQAEAVCYSLAALSSNDSKTLYRDGLNYASQVLLI